MRTMVLLWVALASPAAPANELTAKLDRFVAPLIEQGVFSGVVLLARGDEILMHRAYGNANYEFGIPNTIETRFPVASITKTMVGVMLRKLEHEKKLSLSDPLGKYLPGFPAADKITLEHLRVHRSGVRDPEKLRRVIRLNYSTDEVVDLIAAEPLASAPGEEYSYTTANYALLAKVIEKVTGQTFAEAIERMIYRPAGMRDSGELTRTSVVPRLASGYMPNPYGPGLAVSGYEDISWKVGGGSGYSTARDLHRFVRAFFSGVLTPGQDPRSLMPSSRLFGKQILRTSGGFPGASAHLLHFIEEGITVSVVSNNYAPVTSWIADSVAAMYFAQPYDNPSPVTPLPQAPAANEILGRYKMGTFPPFSVTLRSGQPFLAWNPVRVSALIAVAPDTWFEKLDWLTLKAKRDEGGKIIGFTATAPWSDQPLEVMPVPSDARR